MNYSRRELLGFAAAGVCAAAVPVLLRDKAYARELRAPIPDSQGPGGGVPVLDTKGAYDQATADRIHNRSVERRITRAGKLPGEVRAQVERRLRSLKVNSIR